MEAPRLIKILAFEDSRKVGFGMWLFPLSTYLLFRHLISADHWMICIGFCAVLIGGGTVLDNWIRVKGGGGVADSPKP